jgi:hypothetical protein
MLVRLVVKYVEDLVINIILIVDPVVHVLVARVFAMLATAVIDVKTLPDPHVMELTVMNRTNTMADNVLSMLDKPIVLVPMDTPGITVK